MSEGQPSHGDWDVRSFAVVRVLVKAKQADEARRLLQERRELPEDAYSEEP